MTNEEMERAIDFLLKSQANLEARIEQGNTNLRANIAEVNKNLGERIAEVDRMLGERIARTDEQLARTDRQLEEFADTQADFIRVMTCTWEKQGEFNKSLKATHRELAAAQKRTEETVEKLAQTVDKLVAALGNSGRG